jgi:hypothetical protein
MSLSRAGRKTEAKACWIDVHRPLPQTTATRDGFRSTPGVITPDKLLTPADTDDVKDRDALVRGRELAARPGDKAGARVVRASHPNGRMAGLRLHLAEAELRLK